MFTFSLPVTIGIALITYLVGVQFVGKPIALYGWWFWKTSPHKYASVWSFLLYPMTHWVLWLKGERFCTDRYTCFEMSVGTAFFAPRVVDTYDDREGERMRSYITFVCWCWPLRIATAVCMHVLSVLYILFCGIRWIVRLPARSLPPRR